MENLETPQLLFGNIDATSGEEPPDIESIDTEPIPRRAGDELESVEDEANMFDEELCSISETSLFTTFGVSSCG